MSNYMQNPASGIEHGPYEAAPDWLIAQYVRERRIDPSGRLPYGQLLSDIESEWYYECHSQAVERAEDPARELAPPIEPLHAMHMYERVLRPLWIGRYTAKDITALLERQRQSTPEV